MANLFQKLNDFLSPKFIKSEYQNLPLEEFNDEAKEYNSNLFDLNIDEILENWEVHHALREIIANALDETEISKCAEMKIYKNNQGNWCVQDYGRGLKIEHFTLNENHEKLEAKSSIIGKFGVGLKDSLATLHRHEVKFKISSTYGTFELHKSKKHNFNNITTLHIEYKKSIDNTLKGTLFEFENLPDCEMLKAQRCFLKFMSFIPIETTSLGTIIKTEQGQAKIFINGVLVNEEPNFLFSYNITNLTRNMRKKLNRERNNVGRNVYVDRVKSILKQATSEQVKTTLSDTLLKRDSGVLPDELSWIDIRELALSGITNAVLLTQDEIITNPNLVDSIKNDGYSIVIVDELERGRLRDLSTTNTDIPLTSTGYLEQYNDSFSYTFIEPSAFTNAEKRVWDATPHLLNLLGYKYSRIPEIKISETMRLNQDFTRGVYDSSLNIIVIKRALLSDIVTYAGVLLHEVAHALSGYADCTRDFESVLTEYLGIIASKSIKQ
jgi:hypothetical protein